MPPKQVLVLHRDPPLGESERRYRAFHDNIPLMYFWLDRTGKVLSVNEHGVRELGYTSGELVGQSVFRIFHPEDLQVAERQLREALASPDEIACGELRKIRKDGSVLWLRETFRVVHAADVPEILAICEDVTERRRSVEQAPEYREQLRELNAELLRAGEREERRIARVLHDELGQTLAAARMMICQLRDSELAMARVERLEELREHLDRAIEVTRSFTFQLCPPILHDLGLAAALQALGEQTERAHGILFVFTLGEGWSPPAEDAGVVLYRVLRELFHNVIKHARASSARLELAGTRERIRIVLADDGVGFSVASAGRAGPSLGLLHAREQMTRLDGFFEIDSAPGRGTRATLSLAVTEKEEPARPGGRRSP